MLETQKEIPSCLVPQCKTEAKTRGLCSTHYMYAHRLVTRGQTTWPELERQGKCLGSHSNPSPTKDWFLNGTGEEDITEIVNEPLDAGEKVLEDPNQRELDLDSLDANEEA